jgi:molecular chaperone GrpE (heat shock protein)
LSASLWTQAASPPEEVEQVELEALRAENEELIDTLQRVKAEFDNYRKRPRATRKRWSRGPAKRIVRSSCPCSTTWSGA